MAFAPAQAVVLRMARRLIATLAAIVAALCLPLGAQARTPCPGEQATPTATNAAQVSEAIVCLGNQIRAHHGLPQFRRDARLDLAAALHSLDMGVRSFFGHTNLDGLSPTARAAAQGYTLGVGENIAAGHANARTVVLGWMESAGHCRNLLGSAADLGVGTAVVDGRPYYTQAFGDYFSSSVSPASANACPHKVDLDALTPGAPAPAPGPSAATSRAQAQVSLPVAGAAPLSLRSLSLSPRRFRARGRGTTISFRLSAPATVTLRIKAASGSRAGRRPMSGTITYRGARGANSLRFKARIGRRTLRPGRYRLEVVAGDAAGTTTQVVRSSFVVTRR